jgi:RIO kinase 1
MTEYFNNTYEGNRGKQYGDGRGNRHELDPAAEGNDLNYYEDEGNDYDEYDGLESSLLGESETLLGGGGALGGNKFTIPQLEKKMNLTAKVTNEIIQSEKKGEKRLNYYGRDDRATSEQVLDPRTRMILFKLLNSHYLQEINGCLSTGKEANVYYAKGDKNSEYAVKIFKTSILVFKDRDRYPPPPSSAPHLPPSSVPRYVSGEHRFRHGYCKSNPRKMVRTWAEKEMRNLKRLAAAGIPCPLPRLLKQHVLIMDFLGNDGWCAPRLKEVL